MTPTILSWTIAASQDSFHAAANRRSGSLTLWQRAQMPHERKFLLHVIDQLVVAVMNSHFSCSAKAT